MDERGPYRVSPDGDGTPAERTISDRQAALAGLHGLLIGPAVFIVTALAAVPIAVTIGVIDLVRYSAFRAVAIGHMRLGVASDRVYRSVMASLIAATASCAASVWGRDERWAVDVLGLVAMIGVTLNTTATLSVLLQAANT
jgi:hypothetical protein